MDDCKVHYFDYRREEGQKTMPTAISRHFRDDHFPGPLSVEEKIGVFLIAGGPPLTLDPHQLVDVLQDHFSRYVGALIRGSDVGLRSRFEARFDADAKPRPMTKRGPRAKKQVPRES